MSLSSLHAASHQGDRSILIRSRRGWTLTTSEQAATSFECDGCQHHASFHSLENKEEQAILQRWEEESQQENRKGVPQQSLPSASRKRKRIAETSHQTLGLPGIFEIVDDSDHNDETSNAAVGQLQQEMVGTERKKGGKAAR